MKFASRVLAIAALACAVAAPAGADSWARPVVREVFSASRDHFVRVTPGTAISETFGFGSPGKRPDKDKYATAEFYRRQADRSYRLMHMVTLLNPVAPVEYFVSDEGRMVTVDNWHNRGYGSVLAVYDPAGQPVKAYALTDLFLKSEIDAYPHSVSSRHWHNGPVYLNQDQRTLYMMIASGRDLVLGLETGAYIYCETRAGRYLCRNSNSDRVWRPYSEAVPR